MRTSRPPSRHVPGTTGTFPPVGLALLSGLLVLGLASCDATRNPLTTDGIDDVTASKGNTNKRVTVSPRDSSIAAVGWTVQLSVAVVNGGGKPVPNPSVNWVSLKPEVATVDNTGLVTALSDGRAQITATSQGGVDTATVTVKQIVTSVAVTPPAHSLYVEDEVQLSATALDGARSEAPRGFVWSSSNGAVAKVDTTGLVTAMALGTVTITAVSVPEGVKGTSTITVKATPAPPPPPPPPPPPSGEWDRVLADTVVLGDVVVPDGEKWLIGRGVQVQGNVRTVNGTVALRPGSSLTFVGGVPANYVGGGMHFTSTFANDYGVWIGGMGATGRLDISCTPKRGWNRTGSDPTWSTSDEYFIAPTAVGDYAVRRWTPSEAIPQADPRVPRAEVANVTRDCTIEGPGHIHIHSAAPQRIEYVRLYKMGVTIPGKEDSGRYAIHLHMMGEGARGTVIRGVAAVNSRGRVYVPHASHGAVMEDNVSVNSWAQSLWWDHNNAGDRTHDLTVSQLLVLGTFMPRDLSLDIRPKALVLGSGDRNVMRGSVVAGMTYYDHGNAFAWDAKGDDFGPDVWTLEDNVSHNNKGHGLRIYNTKALPHVIARFTSYRNGNSGIEAGGYVSATRYEDVSLLGNRLSHHANPRTLPADGRSGHFRRLVVEAASGPAIFVTKLSLKATPGQRYEFVDCRLTPGLGSPKVLIKSESVRWPWHAAFIRCGMTPDDVQWTDLTTGENIEGSNILIEHEDGRRWEVTIANGVKVVTALP